jgi:phospho-N-acetylmuramoyl-pentapeptide-transferase
MIPEISHLVARWLGTDSLAILRYTSVRSIGAFVVAFFFVYLLGPRCIGWLYRSGMRDRVRDYGEFFGRSKAGTPTMGGLLMLGAILTSSLLFCTVFGSGVARGERMQFPLLFLTSLWFGGLGAWDDYKKVRGGSSDAGLSRKAKLALQIVFSLYFASVLSADGLSPFDPTIRTQLFMPFPAGAGFDLGWAYVPFVVLVMVSIANAINFADGLDGLAVTPAAFTAVVFGLFAYLMNHSFAASFFKFQYVPGMLEVTVYASAVAGACVGFLWFNAYPAQVFMGDTGSQVLGGTIAALAILSKQELLFLLAGAIFVFEALSVFVQDCIGIKLVGRRFWFRAPAHHGYQYRGIAETKVVLRFWIISLLCAVLSVATLKLR